MSKKSPVALVTSPQNVPLTPTSQREPPPWQPVADDPNLGPPQTVDWEKLNWPCPRIPKLNYFHYDIDELRGTQRHAVWWQYTSYKFFLSACFVNFLHAIFLAIIDNFWWSVLWSGISFVLGIGSSTYIFFTGYKGVGISDATRCLRYISLALVVQVVWSIAASIVAAHMFHGWLTIIQRVQGGTSYADVIAICATVLESLLWMAAASVIAYSVYLVYGFRRALLTPAAGHADFRL